jgi:hypothetical protein
MWRNALGVAANKEFEKRLRQAHHEFGGQVICVRPWSQIDACSLPPKTDLPDLFLLHALLIHGGLPERVIPSVLPNRLGSCQGVLRKLAARGIVEQHQGRWQVTPLGYPPTREALAREGLFVDSI